MKRFWNEQRLWLWPVVVVALLSPFTPGIDLGLAHYFYRDGSFLTHPFSTFMYEYGQLPGQMAFLAAAVVYLLSFVIKAWKPLRSGALICILVMAIGAGLITNALLKDQWGRPRPKQTIEFGGTQEFRPFYEPNFNHQPEPSRGFPCGHCTMGFYFFAPALIGIWTGRKRLAWISMGMALLFGIALSLARMAQGGHYFSDTLFAALVMWLTSYLCCYALLGEREP